MDFEHASSNDSLDDTPSSATNSVTNHETHSLLPVSILREISASSSIRQTTAQSELLADAKNQNLEISIIKEVGKAIDGDFQDKTEVTSDSLSKGTYSDSLEPDEIPRIHLLPIAQQIESGSISGLKDFALDQGQDQKPRLKKEPDQDLKPGLKEEPDEDLKPGLKEEPDEDLKPGLEEEPDQDLKPGIEEEPIPERLTQEEPIQDQEKPIHEEPIHEEPTQEEPTQEERIHEEPIQEKPIHEEPTHEELIHKKPIHEELIHEKTIHEEPIQEAPIQEEPIYEPAQQKVKQKKRRKSLLPVPKTMASPTKKSELNKKKETVDSFEEGSNGENQNKNSVDANEKCEADREISTRFVEPVSRNSHDANEDVFNCDTTHAKPFHAPKCQRSQSIDEKAGSGSKDSSRSSLNRRETIDLGETKTCAGRNLRETQMDLYMNSNEGLLIVHPPSPTHQPISTPAGSAPALRNTIASRMRIEKAHNEHMEPEKSPLEYLTPYQRKEYTIKDLKRQMKQLNRIIEDKESEIDQLREGLGKEAQDLLNVKDEKIRKVQKFSDDLESRYEEIKRSYEESVKTVTNLEATVTDLKDSIAEKKEKTEGLFLEMYVKGQNAARYEREEEIEHMAGNVTDKVYKKTSATPEVNVKEVLAKLNRTQIELAKWQSLRRQESYQESEKPETEAEATLRFLRDSFFHYITDVKGQDDHMRAMIQIFKFTDVQKKKITKALLEKKSKK